MKTKLKMIHYQLYVGLFFILNIANTYFLTTQSLNKYIAPFKHHFFGEVNAFIGNFAVLLLIYLIGTMLFKSARKRMAYLITVTFILNIFIFLLGVFTLFFGTAFSKEAFVIFNNPAEGFAASTAREIFHELWFYYRILVFIPVFTLLSYYIYLSFKGFRHIVMKRHIKSYVINILVIALLWVSSAQIFIHTFNQDISVKSTLASYATQNYGVYPFYAANLLGYDYDIDLEEVLDIDNESDMAELYQTYNKNKDSYVNVFNQQTYTNRLTIDQAIDTLFVDESLSNNDNLHGILEGKNLVLVPIESLNYFLLEFMEKESLKSDSSILDDAVTFMNHIFEQSFVFENMYNNVGMGVSSDGEVSILTGLNPTGDETLYWSYNEKQYELDSLIKYFNEENYYTEAIHGDAAEFYNRDIIYPAMYGFDDYYAIDDFIRDGSNIEQGYLYDMANNLYHVSPWISDFELADYTYQKGSSLTEPYMLYPITMMGHTPYDFGPYEDAYLYPDYDASAFGDIFGITNRYIHYGPYYLDTIKRFFIGDGNTDQTLDDTVYIFYSDHGSDLKSGDISTIMDMDYDLLNERQMLQHIVSFIYVPSNDEYVDYGDYRLRKGLLTGTQPLVRSENDLYRTIVELFNFDTEGDLYFGVHGLSDEPTFALDNRLLDVVLDEYFFSMRNIEQVYPSDQSVDQDVYDYILTYKLLSDYMLTTGDMQNQIKKAVSDIYG